MSVVAPIFKRPRTNAEASSALTPQSSDPFQPIPASILNRQARQQSPVTFLPVQIELSHFRPVAFRVFTKKHNLTLKSDALAILAEYVGRKCGSEWRVLGEPILDEVARAWVRAEGIRCLFLADTDSNPLVEGDLLIPVLKTLEVPHVARSTSFILQSSQPNPSLYESQSGDSTPATYTSSTIDPVQFFSVIDAFSQPKYVYNSNTRTFQQKSNPSIVSAPKEKAALFRERYDIILQRLLRNELFQSYPSHVLPRHQTAGTISSIKNLLGRRNQHFLLFGLLTRSPSGELSLSDPDASISLELTDAVSAGGILAPGVFVLLDGKYIDKNLFRVYTIVLPPSERREASKQVFGHVDFLGAREAGMKGGIVPVERDYEKFLIKAERAAGGIRMVFVGELNLDQPYILKALKSLFEHYSVQDDSQLPLTFVLMGSFMSTPFPANGYSTTYKAHWDALADLLSHFPRLTANCAFVFVPGPNDPWTTSPSCLPRKGIPEAFTNRVRRLCKDARFVSNPTRLSYFTQEICVIRGDIADSLIRNRVVVKSQVNIDPSFDEALLAARELVKTILDQSHLTPFPLHVAPTYWSYDHALRLYPLPTVLVICDTSGWGSFRVTYEGCCVINIGSLLRVDQVDGRGRYTAAWWEWDCGMREGKEIVVGVTDREGREPSKEKRERKRKTVDKRGHMDNKVSGGNGGKRPSGLEDVVPETQVNPQEESQMEEIEFDGEMQVNL